MTFSSVRNFYRPEDINVSKTVSLKNYSQFDNVYKNGTSYANRYLVMYVLKNDLAGNRLGISVSKRIGNSVVRHRITRLIREAYRLAGGMFNSGLDIVVVARTGVRGKNYFDVRDALFHLAKLHHIISL